MKTVLKKLAVIIMCATLVVSVTACERSSVPSASVQEEEKAEKASTEASVSEPSSTEVTSVSSEDTKGDEIPEGPNGASDDDFTGYLGLLGQYYYTLLAPTDTYAENSGEGYYWLADFRYLVDATGKSPLELIGFNAHDYSGDGKLDLIIAGYPTDTEWDFGSDIKAIYTTDENGEYHMTVEGWGRNRQYLLDNGEFYNEGSSGATETCFGTYKLTKDGMGVEWTDFYFSTYNGVTGDIEYYHNTTGIWDVKESEPAKVKDADEFWAIMEAYEGRIVNIDLNPLYSLQGAIGIMGGCLLYPMLASDYAYDATSLRDFNVSNYEYPYDIVLEAYDDVFDVTLCNIEWGEDRGGEQDFTLVPILKIGDIAYGNAVLVTASFPGDTSTLYYKLKDRTGTEHCYYIAISGADGELVMGEFY
ncbi:MAG: hypothetical protein IKR39_02880 [Lachnospiraceae bacterium]|nr:hypothetical protein [Lachnospiraceae bacterium]